MTDNSHQTAIPRKGLPAPTQWLLKQGVLDSKLRILDFGCGKCHDLNNQYFKAEGYDPFHRPVNLTGKYDIVLCNYVLNTLPFAGDRWVVVLYVRGLLANEDSSAFFSVRNDMRALNGPTNKGTWQGHVPGPGDLIKVTPNYRLYHYTLRHNPLDGMCLPG